MSQDRADQLIAEWQSRLARATENLLALDNTVVLKRVEGREGYPVLTLTGITQARLLPTLAAMRELFAQTGALSDLIDRAVRLRRSLNRLWHYEETLAEIERLLTGPSIPLPAIQTPLAERGLLSASQSAAAITPDQLLSAMVSAFGKTKSVVLAVEAAWDRLDPTLDVAETKVGSLEQEAKELHLTAPPELVQARSRLEAWKQQVRTDPLGVQADFDRTLTPLLNAAKETIRQARAEREQIAAKLRLARNTLVEMVAAHAQACAAYANVAARTPLALQENLKPVPDASLLADLEQWLGTLERAVQEGELTAARRGLERWEQSADAFRASERSVRDANQAVCDLPAELQGRLSALRARMGVRGIKDAALGRLAQQAEELLQEPRIPLERLTRLIEACETRVRSAGIVSEQKVGTERTL